jgi:hypothetical protein
MIESTGKQVVGLLLLSHLGLNQQKGHILIRDPMKPF